MRFCYERKVINFIGEHCFWFDFPKPNCTDPSQFHFGLALDLVFFLIIFTLSILNNWQLVRTSQYTTSRILPQTRHFLKLYQNDPSGFPLLSDKGNWRSLTSVANTHNLVIGGFNHQYGTVVPTQINPIGRKVPKRVSTFRYQYYYYNCISISVCLAFTQKLLNRLL